MSWLKHPDKLFPSNKNIKKGANLPTDNTGASGGDTKKGTYLPADDTGASGSDMKKGTYLHTDDKSASGSNIKKETYLPTDDKGASGSDMKKETYLPTDDKSASGSNIEKETYLATDYIGASGSNVKKGTYLPTDDKGASGSDIKTKSNINTKKTSLPNNNILPLDTVEKVIKNAKSNKEFKSLLEIVLNIMSNKNVGNSKNKIDLFESFLDNYQCANANYMKQIKAALTDCESLIPIASYLVDNKECNLYMSPRTGNYQELQYLFGESRIARGEMSKNNVKREVVMKLNPIHHEYIINEIAVLAKLKHPNIIESLGFFFSGVCNKKGIILEFMNFSDLARGLEMRIVDLSKKNLKKILIDLTTGMEYVHSQKILHRDLQLMHFLCNDKNQYKIGGFGKAVYVGNSNGKFQSLVSSVRRGHPLFEAPEWRGTERFTYTYQTDVWIMGCYFKIILVNRRETYRLCRDDITERLEVFVNNFMLAENPGSRKDFAQLKALLQNMEI
uniref:Serine/threonine-protein kinase pakA-like n=1 Tax=Diabrotica virgifera virgifera TaxID=50390 RepID=A0A6P7GNT8_DIAVI